MIGWGDVTFLIVAVLIHELGHVAGYALFSKELPKLIVLKWGAVAVGDKEYMKRFTVQQIAIVALFGIIPGSIPLFVIGNWFIIWVYFLACSADTAMVVNYFTEPQLRKVKYGNIEEKVMDKGY